MTTAEAVGFEQDDDNASHEAAQRKLRRWCRDETKAFADLYVSGKSLKDCCIIFGRTEAAAIKHLQQCGYVRTVKPSSRGGRPKRAVPVVDLTARPVAGEPEPLGVDSGCLWISGEPAERLFCGEDRVHGSPWCQHHHVRAYDRVSTVKSAEKVQGAVTNGQR